MIESVWIHFLAISYGSGYAVNFVDIAPAYSSIVFALGNTISTIDAFISNLIAALIIKRPIIEDWRKLLLLFSIIYIIGGVVYLFYGSAVARKWATWNHQKLKTNSVDESSTAAPCQAQLLQTIDDTEEY